MSMPSGRSYAANNEVASCPICLDDLGFCALDLSPRSDLVVCFFGCKVVFHSACLHEWTKQQSSCPNCRAHWPVEAGFFHGKNLPRSGRDVVLRHQRNVFTGHYQDWSITQGVVQYVDGRTAMFSEADGDRLKMKSTSKSGKFLFEGLVDNGTYRANGLGEMVSSKGHFKGIFEKGLFKSGTTEFSNGDAFTGEFNNWKPEGAGVMVTVKGVVVEGNFVAGKIHGQGTRTKNDYRHVGSFLRGIVEGTGTRFYKNGDVYIGEWVAGKRQGLGKLTYADGGYYEGGYFAGEKHGWGCRVKPDYEIYEGDFVMGIRQGRGIVERYDSQTKLLAFRYEGDWEQGRRAGMGVLVTQNGSVEERYDGSFFNGKRHGRGTVSIGNSVVFVGAFINGRREGPGKAYLENGDQVQSYWSQGKRNGETEVWFASGDHFKGTYNNGVKLGYGERRMRDGSIYRGYYKDGERHGKGEYTNPKMDLCFEGIWHKGVMHGYGRMWQVTDGARVILVEGNWVDGVPPDKLKPKTSRPVPPLPKRQAVSPPQDFSVQNTSKRRVSAPKDLSGQNTSKRRVRRLRRQKVRSKTAGNDRSLEYAFGELDRIVGRNHDGRRIVRRRVTTLKPKIY